MRTEVRRNRVGPLFHRWYSAATGRYTRVDPLGLIRDARQRVRHAYVYARNNPVLYLDPLGLAEFCCRALSGFMGRTGQRHCFLRDDDGTAYSLFPELRFPQLVGVPKIDDPSDASAPDADCVDCEGCDERDIERCLTRETISYPIAPYEPLGPNSNTFAGQLARECCENGEDIVNSTRRAPGINHAPPGRN